MSLARQSAVSFFAKVDAELVKLIARLSGDQLVSATRARAAIGELVRTCDDHPALLRLVRALQSAPGKPRGKPFRATISDQQIEDAMQASAYNVARAARALGWRKGSLYRRLARKSPATAGTSLQGR